MAGEAHSFAGDFFANALHLEHNRASFDLGDVVFGVAFTAAHFQAQSFFGGLCGEQLFLVITLLQAPFTLVNPYFDTNDTSTVRALSASDVKINVGAQRM